MKQVKKILVPIYVILALLGASCAGGQEKDYSLEASAFRNELMKTPDAVLLDVRTPGEFEQGHLPDAINYDWNGKDFQARVEQLDPSKPMFVYCLSGGRSAEAAKSLRAKGFKNVYELKGGIMKWRGLQLPETKASADSAGAFSKSTFDAMLEANTLVLVDFYAPWCQPCKKMELYLKEIKEEQKETLHLIRLNVDEHQQLCKELKVDTLPVLQLYKNKKLIWEHEGYIEKDEVLKQLAKNTDQ
ncbi:thioredoxin domain-containing protein [Niabella insulamsoli]|uniref:thioredoxin domain-containing protein n=1 Tax=Niabella insulamsoli TaxID=3144874 RepID=UPI0031FE3694